MLLWIIFACLTAAALVAVLRPLFRSAVAQDEGPSFDEAIYRDQLREIEADRARGLIGEGEAEGAEAEIARRLLAAAEKPGRTDATGGVQSPDRRAPVLTGVLVAGSITAVSLGLYLTYGSPGVPDQPRQARLETAPSAQGLDDILRKVEARLRQHPEDGRGWDAVAPVYLSQRRYRDAADAYGRAIRLLGVSAKRLVGRAESLVLAANGIVSDEARAAFEKALQQDGSIAKARFWIGMAEQQDGKLEAAIKIWHDMLSQAPADVPWRRLVAEHLVAAQRKLGKEPSVPVAQAETQPAAPGPSREDVAAAQQMSPQQRSAMINQMVEGLAERLKEDGSDLQGWLRLVRAYTVLGRRDDAAEALSSARRNFQGDEQALAQLSTLAKSLGL